MKAIIVMLLALASTAYVADDVSSLLKDGDRFRTGQDDLQVETHVVTFNRDGSPDKERRYTVFAQAQHKSLVLMRFFFSSRRRHTRCSRDWSSDVCSSD